MEHSRESHATAVDSLCRLCGSINVSMKKGKRIHYVKPTKCSSMKDKLLFCNIDIQNDTPEFHSQYLCDKCRCKVNNCIRRTSVQTKKTLTNLFESTAGIWCAYDKDITIESCCVCSEKIRLSVGVCKKERDIPVNNTQYTGCLPPKKKAYQGGYNFNPLPGVF